MVSSGDQEFESFLRSYYAQVPAEDLEHRNPDELRAVARCHWDLAQQRAPGTAIVRVFAPKRAEDGWDANHTIVQIVNDDMPFLVDSVTMDLERHDLGLHLVVHPIVRVRRDAAGRLLGLATGGAADPEAPEATVLESFLYVEVDRETDPVLLAELTTDLERVLGDVRAATDDWLKMLARLRQLVDELRTAPPAIDAEDLAEGTAFLQWMGDQHFTFLGCRTYDLERENGEDVLRAVPGTGLGILRGGSTGASRSFASLPPEIRARPASGVCSC